MNTDLKNATKRTTLHKMAVMKKAICSTVHRDGQTCRDTQQEREQLPWVRMCCMSSKLAHPFSWRRSRNVLNCLKVDSIVSSACSSTTTAVTTEQLTKVKGQQLTEVGEG